MLGLWLDSVSFKVFFSLSDLMIRGAQFRSRPFAILIRIDFASQRHFLKKVLPQLTKPQISSLQLSVIRWSEIQHTKHSEN